MRPAIVLTLLAALAVAPLQAQAPVREADEVIRYRQSLYATIGWNFGPIAAMLKGERAWNAAELKRRSIAVAFAAVQLDEAFAPGSDAVEKTDALPEIWEEPQAFADALREFQAASNQLRIAFAGAAEEPIRAAFERTRKACKGCHERFRAD